LKAGKHVFVEKPLALSYAELDDIEAVYDPKLCLTVGFNRRFAPHVQKMKTLLESTDRPKSFIVTVNAGEIPANHWTQDADIGGGRIIGEACHFIDLLRHLAGHKITVVRISPMTSDTVSIGLEFEDGSIGTIHYYANGHRSYPKERIEAFCGGKILQLDNFRCLRGYGWRGFKTMRLLRQDKGQANLVRAFIDCIENGTPPPIPVDELFEVSRVTLNAAAKVRE